MVDFGSSIADDYELIDGIETVSIVDAEGTTTSSGVAAKRSQLSFRELQFGGGAGYDATDVVWRLWANTLTVTPVPGDAVHEATGEEWSIQSLTSTRIGNVIVNHQCVCKKRG